MSEIMLVLLAAPPLARNALFGSAAIGRPFYCKERSANQIDALVATVVCRNKVAHAGNANIDRCYIYDTDENVITKYWVNQKIQKCWQWDTAFFR